MLLTSLGNPFAERAKLGQRKIFVNDEPLSKSLKTFQYLVPLEEWSSMDYWRQHNDLVLNAPQWSVAYTHQDL